MRTALHEGEAEIDRKTREALLAYSRSPEFRELVESTIDELGRVVKGYRSPYVAFSGGKDSIVTLHLAVRVRPDVWVWHWDHGGWLMPRRVESEVVGVLHRLQPRRDRVVVRTSPRLWDPDARWDYKRWYRAFFGALAREVKERGWDLCLLGVRGEEGVLRRARYKGVVRMNGVDTFCPIHSWSWRDVWAYIASNNLPYPSHYDRLAPVLGYDKTRLVTFFDKEFECFGSPNLDHWFYWKCKYKTG